VGFGTHAGPARDAGATKDEADRVTLDIPARRTDKEGPAQEHENEKKQNQKPRRPLGVDFEA